MDNGFILTFGALYKKQFHKWPKVHIAISVKQAFCNFAILEPWTCSFVTRNVHIYQAKHTNPVQLASKQVQHNA